MEKAGSFTKQIFFLTLLVAAVIAAVNFFNPLVSIGIAIALAFLLFLVRKPVYSIILLILATPFSATEILDTSLAGIPGMKIANILAVAAIILLLMKKKPAKLSKEDRIFIYGLLIIFTVAVLRSVSYIGLTYNMIWTDQYSLTKYLLSHLVKPLLIFLPFILISVFVRSKEEIEKIIISVMLSIILLSVTILILYIFFTTDKLNFEAVRIGFSKVLGMHDNNLADFYIAVYPILLAYAVNKKSWFWAGGVFVSLCAIGIIYSRSAYLVIILCTFAFFLVSRRARLLPWVIGAALAALNFIPQTIIQRALTGLADNDLNAISAGRVAQIWLPLIQEFLAQPLKLITGAGRYAIMGTVAFKSGQILQVGHAHSMYLDTLLDSGMIGLIFFLAFFFLFLRKFLGTHKYVHDSLYVDILTGIEISIAAFLIRGVTDSFFFPTLTNAFLWINLGIGTAIVYLFREQVKRQDRQPGERPDGQLDELPDEQPDGRLDEQTYGQSDTQIGGKLDKQPDMRLDKYSDDTGPEESEAGRFNLHTDEGGQGI